MKYELRGYQKDLKKLTYQAIRGGFKRIIQWVNMGGGKGVSMPDYAADALKSGKKVLVVMRRRDLIFQTKENFKKYNQINASIIMGKEKGYDQKNPVQICSIDTIRNAIKKPEYSYLASFDLIQVDECFDEETELLTENGFVFFKELKNEKIAQFDQDTRNINFVNPLRKIKKEKPNNMLLIESKTSVSLLVTDNHEILIYRNGAPLKVLAKDLNFNYYNKFATSGFAVGKESHLSDFEKLMIAYQADGSEHYKRKVKSGFIASFSFKKERKINEFMGLMRHGNFNHKEIMRDGDKRRFMVYLDNYFTKNVYDYFSIKKLSLNKSREIIEYMNIWDGHKASKNCYLFTTTNEMVANFYQSVACLSGYKTKLTKVVDERNANFSDVYRLFINKRNEISSQTCTKSRSSYRGPVYCVTVPSGNIIIRRRGIVLVTGNCHDTTSNSYAKLFDFLGDDKIYLGFTATPFAIGNKPLLFWEKTIKPINPSELRDLGYNAPCRIYRPDKIDTTGIKKQGGDFSVTELFELVNDLKIIGDAIDSYKKYGNGKPFIGFCVNIDHSKIMAKAFSDAGITAIHIDQSHNKKERKAAKDGLENGSIKGVFNVNIFSTGWDCPTVEVMLGLRPTMSEILALQQWGRVLRTSKETGKTEAIILDHADNTSRHGFPYDDNRKACISHLQLDQKKKEERKDEIKVKDCPICGLTIEYAVKECWGCGFRFVAKTKNQEVVHEDGDLIEVSQNDLTVDNVFTKIEKSFNRFQDLEKQYGSKPIAKYFKLHEKHGNQIFSYMDELKIPKWFESTVKKNALEKKCFNCKKFRPSGVDKYSSRFLIYRSEIKSHDIGYCNVIGSYVKKIYFCINFMKR